MTTTSFQDDFHREVERQSKEAEGIPQTDITISAGDIGLKPWNYEEEVRLLLAEVREQTIRECAEIARTATMFTGCPLECMADEVRDAVLSLLRSNGEGK